MQNPATKVLSRKIQDTNFVQISITKFQQGINLEDQSVSNFVRNSVTKCQQGIDLEGQNVTNFVHNPVTKSRHGTHLGKTICVTKVCECVLSVANFSSVDIEGNLSAIDFDSIPLSGTVGCAFPAGTDERVSVSLAVDSLLPTVAVDFTVSSDDFESFLDCAEVDRFMT